MSEITNPNTEVLSLSYKNGKYLLEFPENIISQEKIPRECIKDGTLSHTRFVSDNSTVKEMINLVDQLGESIIDFNIQHEGEKAGRQIMLKELKELVTCNELLTFLDSQSHLSTHTFLLLITLIERYLKLLSIEVGKLINELSLEDMNNPQFFYDFYASNNNNSVCAYLKKFYSNVLLIEVPSSNMQPQKQKAEFNHPMILDVARYKRIKGNKTTTINTNTIYPCKVFFDWLCSTIRCFKDYGINDLPLWKLKEDHFWEYRAYLVKEVKNGNITELSAKKRFQRLKGVFNKLRELGKVNDNFYSKIPNIQSSEYIYRDIPTEDQLRCFFDVIGKYSNHPKRDRLVYGLMLLMGLRKSEAAYLRKASVNFEKQTLTFKRKGRVVRTLPIPSILKRLLEDYTFEGEDYLFSNEPKGFVSKIGNDYKVYSYLANWEFKGGPHLLRHTFITLLCEKCDPRTLQYLSGHESLHALSKYIHVTPSNLSKKIELMEYVEGE
ncbi:tyrosine-type recombinase/integrase [Guptibacillus hwajinpoensis]|uniref:tyrosine-type recombinase/integrase n=1 Tax=Guptibacillus hwajinpoensis TaxID=208199 RepID=UPI001CFDDCAF|nr:site-specific integrase [Pseudalkalibacillus hwajinpoensis]WLR60167.1 site-specific integrase [Pseudalkalibacillus hwajinpoensis]